MPYCRKCGAELKADAQFCHICGTTSTPTAAVPSRRRVSQPRRPSQSVTTIILVSILVFAAIFAALVLLPLNPVTFNQSNEASAANVNKLNMLLNADIANVNVLFKNLSGNQRAAINLSAIGSQGIFASEQPVSLAFQEKTIGSTLTYNVGISRTDRWNAFLDLQVTCDVYIDPSTSLSLTVQTVTGDITLNADQTLTIENLHLETTTGSIDVTLTEKTTIVERVDIKTTTGSAHLHWDEAKVSGNVQVTLKATTGIIQIRANYKIGTRS